MILKIGGGGGAVHLYGPDSTALAVTLCDQTRMRGKAKSIKQYLKRGEKMKLRRDTANSVPLVPFPAVFSIL